MVTRYLNLISLAEAKKIICTAFSSRPERTTTVALSESVGRIVAEDLIVPFTVPPAPLAAMDGYAVASTWTHGASDQNPVTVPGAIRVNTGNVMPEGTDALIMVEDTWEIGDGIIQVRSAVRPGQHVRPAGEDVTLGQIVFPAGHCIRPADTGALATYACTSVPVRDVSIGLIPTGSELIPPGTHPEPGQVVESNMEMTRAFLKTLGVTPVMYPITPDSPEAIREVVLDAIQNNDMVIISAGSSAGTRDFTSRVIQECGEVLFHGVSMKPGKPVICGNIFKKPVIGMPGYPLSAVVILEELIAPLFAVWGFFVPKRQKIEVFLAQRLVSDGGIDEFVYLSAGKINGKYIAVPLSRGAGVQMAALSADLWLHIPPEIEGYAEGTVVTAASLFKEPTLDATILVAGVHDPIIGVADSMMRGRGRIIRFRNTGEVSGLLALASNACHLAAVRYDPTSGSVGDIFRRWLPGIPVKTVPVADIVYGIAGNAVYSIQDISLVRFIFPLQGSPQEALLYRLMKEAGTDGDTRLENSIRGDEIAILSALKNGSADAGFCSEYNARSAGLSFSPIGNLRYDLIYRTEMEQEQALSDCISIITSDAWKKRVQDTPGYFVSDQSEVYHNKRKKIESDSPSRTGYREP
ncbi:MAG: molybdopterin biosynthesis protein [Methanospirillaceae archaeon]|nr:molybdopterin biosynthesis protein [Methanospirillaceae archaeon]